MLYLVLSLLAGMFFIIFGKVKYKETVYLEGSKARIAGLIFLAPIGLILFVVIFVIFFAIFEITISESSYDLIDNFASSFVRNGFLIGLAYINFHSVSRDTKEQTGCLRNWLGYAVIISLLMVWFILPTFLTNADFFTAGIIGVSIFQLIFISGIWLWKKWGAFGYAVTNLITPIIAFLRVGSFSDTVVSLVQSLSLILVLYLLVKPKWQFFE